jgi:glucose-6-phosphate 1-dehydrogenase
MNVSHSDALVFFGATGDLAYKKIFPSLQAMIKRGHLNVPVIGVAKAGWNIDQLRARARDSVEKHGGGVDPTAFGKLCGLLRYVDGDYKDGATFQAIRKELDSAQRPAHYLAIPPGLFGLVVEQLAKAGCTKDARVIVEKPLATLGVGTQSDSARHFRRATHLSHRSLFGKRAVRNMVSLRFENAILESFWHRNQVESVQITMAEHFGVQGRGAFYDQTGAIRDVVQNHLFQILANLAMEPPVRTDSETIRNENGVAPNSKVETFSALQLNVDSWRWQGVPFYIRAGKSLPVTCTEIVVRLREPPIVFPTCCRAANYFRFRVSPDVTAAFGLTVMDPQEKMIGEQTELLASRYPSAEDMDAYERVLGDAMNGDATLFAREDYVEEAWRIVDPVLKAGTPVYEYEPGTRGPNEVDQKVSPPRGWENPVVNTSAK